MPLRLPPLRERTEDIAPLVTHFLKQASNAGLPVKRFSPDGIRALADWSWPGNVRELENLVRRLMVLVGEEVISADVVEAELAAVRPAVAEPIEADSLSQSVDQHIRRYFDALEGAMPPPGLHGRVLREVEYPLIVATLEITVAIRSRLRISLALTEIRFASVFVSWVSWQDDSHGNWNSTARHPAAIF